MSRPAKRGPLRWLLPGAATAALISLTGCGAGWVDSTEVTGYAVCDESEPTRITVFYISGHGVEEVDPTVRETEDAVEIEITLRGSGNNPAIGLPGEIEINLDSPVGTREVRDAGGAAVRVQPCEEG